MLGIKQEAMAYELGDDWNQKKVSLLEQKDAIDDDTLQQIADILKIPVEAIANFDEEQGINNIISNTFHESAYFAGHSATFNVNPIEKWLEALEEIKRLNAELLKVKDEQIKLLQSIVEKK